MKIRNVQVKTTQDAIILSAQCTIRKFGEDQVYFKFSKAYKDFLFADASPFAAALLIPSMKLGEDLIIEGSISEKLYKGMHEIMEIMLSWDIGLKPIAIKADTLTKDTQQATKIASFFSGGVDSFYTYLKNKKTTDGKLSYFLVANGYDIALDNTKLWKATTRDVKKIAKEEHIQIIEAESNVRPLIEPIMVWDFTHGGCLAAIALCLRKKLKTVYIASSDTYEDQCPWGSSLATDKWWGTETLSFIHDGCEANRVQKVQAIVSLPIVLNNLRVCYKNIKDTYNCGHCEKCLRTMVSLAAIGALSKAKTFPKGIDVNQLKKLSLTKNVAMHHRENLELLQELQREPELQKAVETMLANASDDKPDYIHDIIHLCIYIDFMYNRSRISKMLKKSISNDTKIAICFIRIKFIE